MANVDNPNGFTPVRHLTGGVIRANEYGIATDYGTAIFTGDLVYLDSDTGKIEVATATVAAVLGVFAGCQFTKENGEIVYSPYWPAAQATLGNADGIAYVYDDPNIVFAAQHDGTGAVTGNGALFDLTATAGNTATGRSKQEIDTDASTVDLLRQIRLVPKPDNAWGANAEVEVVIHNHNLAPAAGATAPAS